MCRTLNEMSIAYIPETKCEKGRDEYYMAWTSGNRYLALLISLVRLLTRGKGLCDSSVKNTNALILVGVVKIEYAF